jgi:hypothetical protein
MLHVGETVVGLLRQGAIDEALDLGRQIGPVQGHLGRWLGQDALEEVHSRLAGERQLAGQRLEQEDAKPIDIRAPVDAGGKLDGFGRHVGRRAEHGQGRYRGRRLAGPFHHHGDAKIENLGG